eukprot:15427-Heterococcus_DN1.PRE.1
MAVMQALAIYRYCSHQRAAQVSSALLLQLPISDVTAGQAVGYFGVGFFSVFALSDSPSIESGDRKMTFAWGGSNGERLFAHSESITTANNSNTTANSTAATSTGTAATSGQSWTTLGFPLKHNAEPVSNDYTYT